MESKISEEEFVINAIKKLRKPPYKGIHSVFSGFNSAFREYFGKDPVEVTTKMAKEGKILIRPAKRGVMLYLPEDNPDLPKTEEVIRKILSEE
ncbi:MAG: hypothetical protein H5T44_06285 [Thermoplasmatales archaeon]|nr:hypothetical protein [Thermoplasmatales archaeon]